MKNLKINLKKLKALVLAGSLSLAMAGCSNPVEDQKTDATMSDATMTDAIAEEQVLETTAAVDENQEYYETIEEMENNIDSFAKTYLPYGFGEVEIDDTNKQAMAEMYTNAYIMLNARDMGKSLAVLDQNLEIIPSETAEDFMKFARLTAHYSQIQTPDTMLDFSTLVTNDEDALFLNSLSTEIAYMNVAKTPVERQERINNIIEIKKNLSEYYELKTYDYSTMYIAINMMIEADATAKAYGTEIFTTEEDKNQVYNTILKYNCGEVAEENWSLIAIEDVQAKNSFESKVSVYYKAVLEDMLKKVENMGLGNFDSYYSYASVTGRISEKLVGLYVKPEMTNIELENSIRENGPANKKDGKGSSSSTVVPEDQVPDSEKVPATTEYDWSNNGDTDIPVGPDVVVIPGSQVEVVDADTARTRGESAGRYDGSAAAYNQQISTGSVPSEISSAPTPSVPSDCSKYSSDYKEGYKSGYVAAYNNYVASAKAAQSKPETHFEPVENGEEIVIEETTQDVYYNNSTQETNTNETTFIPVDGNEEIIDEEIITISNLKELRKMVVSAYASAYVDNYYNELENNSAKRV